MLKVAARLLVINIPLHLGLYIYYTFYIPYIAMVLLELLVLIPWNIAYKLDDLKFKIKPFRNIP